MSGRSRLPSTVMDSCSKKSQCATMPANSATRLSVISPHWPRMAGARNAFTRLPVSDCSRCCDSARSLRC
jgi:hypothetical protein